MLLTRAPLSGEPKPPFPFDLHVLGTPPALILSQDQTLSHKSWQFSLVSRSLRRRDRSPPPPLRVAVESPCYRWPSHALRPEPSHVVASASKALDADSLFLPSFQTSVSVVLPGSRALDGASTVVVAQISILPQQSYLSTPKLELFSRGWRIEIFNHRTCRVPGPLHPPFGGRGASSARREP